MDKIILKYLIIKTLNIFNTPTDRESLLASPSQNELRDFFRNKLEQHDAGGIFIISPDNKNLISMRDNNLADENIIGLKYPERLARVFDGYKQLIPPIHSDVPLPNDKGEMIDWYPTMFVVAPIKNIDGKVIAALSIRINPFKDFSQIAQTGQFGKSGETYLIDEFGYMISESRFTKS